MFKAMGVVVTTERTVHNHTADYLHHAVKKVWTKAQAKLQENIALGSDSGNELSVAGDARCDSMGHR